jgi:hypothetical protein
LALTEATMVEAFVDPGVIRPGAGQGIERVPLGYELYDRLHAGIGDFSLRAIHEGEPDLFREPGTLTHYWV